MDSIGCECIKLVFENFVDATPPLSKSYRVIWVFLNLDRLDVLFVWLIYWYNKYHYRCYVVFVSMHFERMITRILKATLSTFNMINGLRRNQSILMAIYNDWIKHFCRCLWLPKKYARHNPSGLCEHWHLSKTFGLHQIKHLFTQIL